MFLHYIKVTLRRLSGYLLVSLLNIFGLSTGIACFVFIVLFVVHELNYDRYNEHYDDIYRIAVDARMGSTIIKQLGTPARMPTALYQEFPEISAISRIYVQSLTVVLDDRAFNEKNTAAVDSSFSEIFTLDFIEGSPDRVLNAPGQVIIDRTTARKYFGDTPAYGRVMMIEDTIPLTITGVYEDFPVQSHFHFNILVSLVTFDGLYNNQGWFYNDFATYLRLQKGYPEEKLEVKLPSFVDDYMYGGKYEETADDENFWTLYLQKLKEIHLGSDLSGEFESNGNLSYVRIFSAIGVLILLVACLNFMNLATAGSSIRGREVGIRKAIGASRGYLRQQFFTEALGLSLISMLLALALVASLMGTFQNLTGREIVLHPPLTHLIVPVILGLTFFVGCFSGSYPAFYMSGFSALEALGFKGSRQSTSRFRNFLVLFQFTIAIALIVSTILVQSQMRLVLQESLGFDKTRTILVRNASYLDDQLDLFTDELRNRPEISQVATSLRVPGDKLMNWAFGASGFDGNFTLNINLVDETYQETMGMHMAAGRFFSTEFGAETDRIILNETALELLGFEQPIGKTIHRWGNEGNPIEVIGIIEDYHWESKKQLIRPHALMHLKAIDRAQPEYLSVRVGDTDVKKVIAILEEEWKTHVTKIPFEYEFLDRHYEGIYHNEKQTRGLVGIFALLAIVISCIGLFGLASFMADGRRKEVGIRKVNGASTFSIMGLLTFDFTRWVLIANIIAWPLSWLAMRNWLEDFAYRTQIHWWIFVLGGIAAFIIAFSTVSYHAFRASRKNPGITLRYE